MFYLSKTNKQSLSSTKHLPAKWLWFKAYLLVNKYKLYCEICITKIGSTYRTNQMIQPWLFVWCQGFSGTKAQGNGVCWCLSHSSRQDFRWCSGISQLVLLFMWKGLLMTKNGAVSTEGITQPQIVQENGTVFLEPDFTELLKQSS